jgi:hypothetical protein
MDEERIRDAAMKDPLAQMHLLLREHGWEPELDQRPLLGVPTWYWHHPSRKNMSLGTWKHLDGQVVWNAYGKARTREDVGRLPSTSVARLRLKELATPRPHSPHGRPGPARSNATRPGRSKRA